MAPKIGEKGAEQGCDPKPKKFTINAIGKEALTYNSYKVQRV